MYVLLLLVTFSYCMWVVNHLWGLKRLYILVEERTAVGSIFLESSLKWNMYINSPCYRGLFLNN